MGDHSLRLQVDVDKELPPEQNAMVFELYNRPGYFIFKEVEIEASDLNDLPEEKPVVDDKKSPSQRLRDRLFVYYKNTFGKTEDFEVWRVNELDRIGNHYLNKIKE